MKKRLKYGKENADKIYKKMALLGFVNISGFSRIRLGKECFLEVCYEREFYIRGHREADGR